MYGIKHLIQCHCVLPQFRNRRDAVYHQFLVFSVVKDDDTVDPKFVECTNCGAIHKVIELGRSEIVLGREDLTTLISKDDMKLGLPQNVVQVLESYSCDLPTWEEVEFSLNNGLWGKEIILRKEEINGVVQGKLLRIMGPTQIKIEPFTREDVF